MCSFLLDSVPIFALRFILLLFPSPPPFRGEREREVWRERELWGTILTMEMPKRGLPRIPKGWSIERLHTDICTWLHEYTVRLGGPAPLNVMHRRFGTLSRCFGLLSDIIMDLHAAGRVMHLEHHVRGRRLVWNIDDWNALSDADRAGPVGYGERPRPPGDTAFFRPGVQNLDTSEKT